MALADELAGFDAFAVEVGRHADVADHHVRRGGLRTVDEPVVILGLTDDLQVGWRESMALTPSWMKMLSSATKTVIAPMHRFNTTAPARLGRGHPDVGDASHTPRTPVSALETQAVGAQY